MDQQNNPYDNNQTQNPYGQQDAFNQYGQAQNPYGQQDAYQQNQFVQQNAYNQQNMPYGQAAPMNTGVYSTPGQSNVLLASRLQRQLHLHWFAVSLDFS